MPPLTPSDLVLDPEPLRRQRQENFGRLLLRALRAFEADMREISRDRQDPELSSSHRLVLENLDPAGIRITEVARRTGLAKQTVGPLLRDLAERGYLQLDADPSDGRARRVRYSERGLRHIALDLAVIDDVVERYTEVLGEQFMWHLQSSLLMFLECFERRESTPGEGAAAGG